MLDRCFDTKRGSIRNLLLLNLVMFVQVKLYMIGLYSHWSCLISAMWHTQKWKHKQMSQLCQEMLALSYTGINIDDEDNLNSCRSEQMNNLCSSRHFLFEILKSRRSNYTLMKKVAPPSIDGFRNIVDIRCLLIDLNDHSHQVLLVGIIVSHNRLRYR